VGSAVDLSYWQVGVAGLLILVNAAASLALRLGLERRLLLAAARMVVQLLLVGLVLQAVFEQSYWYVVVALSLLMIAAAAVAAVRRVGRRYPGALWDSLLSIWASSWLVGAYAVFAVVQVEPWYDPRYAIPLLGMILGNMVSGVSLGLERLGEELAVQRPRVEALLALGGTRWEAARPAVRQAVRTGMIPTLNSMLVMGIVSLPGMMTGQILAEGQPTKAVKYQIVIMFLIAAGTALALLAVVLLGFRRLFSARHQFLYGRIAEKG
jgi:putative ABC transport system permease protein